jgi:hypothetical protein
MSAFSTAQSGAKSATSSMPSKTRFAHCRCGWPVARTRSPGSVVTRLSVGPEIAGNTESEKFTHRKCRMRMRCSHPSPG